MLRAMIRGLMHWASREPASSRVGDNPYSSGHESAHRAWRVSPLKAINGRVLEVAVYSSNPHGCDWTCELFIIPEDMTIAEGIVAMMAVKSLEQ